MSLKSKVKATPVLGIGAGGHAKVVIEILRLMHGYEVVGLLDVERERWGSKVLGVTVLGDESLLDEMFNKGVRTAFIGVGMVKSSEPRRRLYQQIRQAGFEIVSAVHPQAIISPSAKFADGPTIMAGAIINANASLGDNVIINTGAVVEHDCTIGNHVHVATGARLAGRVRVEEGTHIGLGATVKQEIIIGRNVVVGAGAVVVENVPDQVVVTGVPARVRSVVED